MPSELLDYVVVHELAHRKEMNHSPRFWAVVEKELPDYRERREKLKKWENSWDKTRLFFAIHAKVMYNIRQGGGT